jgi:ubiquinone/menaquinone biosynthesis C-methylase UbiE
LAAQKEFFDNAARQYGLDAVNVPGASHFRNMVTDKALKKTLTPVLKQFRGLTILEVGCGVGRWTKIVAEKNSVIGVDQSRFMIAMAKYACRGRHCSFVVADASFLPFKENTFDLVFSICVLQHLLDEHQLVGALSGMARCGKSKALIVEEMWSAQEILLKKVYCPTRIVPLKSYIRIFLAVGLRPRRCWGITPARFLVRLTSFLSSKPKIVEGNLMTKFKSSQLLSEAIHFVMGVGMLSSILAPVGNYNPCFSQHTILIAEKINKEKDSNEKN